MNLDDGSSQSRGLFTVTVTESDLLNVLDQYLSYSIHLVDANGKKKVSYTDTHFNNSGTINISSSAFPGPNPGNLGQLVSCYSGNHRYAIRLY